MSKVMVRDGKNEAGWDGERLVGNLSGRAGEG